MTRFRLALVALLALPLTLTACDIGDPTEGFSLRFNYSAADANVSTRVVDAATGNPLEVPVSVAFSGQDADRLVDIQGDRVETLEVTPDGGVAVSAFNVGIDGAPSAQAPARIRMRITAPGYIATAFPVSVSTSEKSLTVRMVRRDAPPAGVSVAQRTATADAAGTQEAVTVEAGSAAGLTIPQGTQLKDAAGQPVQGALQVDFAAFDAASEDAAAAFPGGALGAEVETAAGAAVGSFTSAGFVSIHIEDAAGNTVSRYSQPVTVRIPVAAGTRNPQTGQPFQAGDAIGVFSLTEAEGVWREEAAATVATRGGELVAEFAITHNSYYSVGAFEAGSCSAAATVTVANIPAGANDYHLRWRLVEGGSTFASGALSGNTVTLEGAPAGRAYTFQVLDADGAVLGETVINDLCGAEARVNADLTGYGPRVSVEGHVAVTCPSGDVEVRPSNYSIYFKQASGKIFSEALMKDGAVYIHGVEDGAEYDFKVQVDGEWYSRTVEIRDDVAFQDLDGTIDVQRQSDGDYVVQIDYNDSEGYVCD